MSLQHGEGPVTDPGLSGGFALGEEAPHRVPEVFKDVDEVHDDGDVGSSVFRCCFDAVDLVVVAIHESHPG